LSIWDDLDGAGGILYQDDRVWECRLIDVEGMLRQRQLDDRVPFSLWEVSYTNGSRAPGKVFVPAGAALGAKFDIIARVLGPLRLEADVPFAIPSGSGFDPVWDYQGKVVTHRTSRTSQHQYRPEVWGDKPNAARGTALDFRPRDLNERRAWYLERLREGPWELPEGVRGVSIGNYLPGRMGPDGGIHVDLRPGKPWRQTMS